MINKYVVICVDCWKIIPSHQSTVSSKFHLVFSSFNRKYAFSLFLFCKPDILESVGKKNLTTFL